MDSEIQAMAEISEALADLEPDAAERVLKWANARFQIVHAAPIPGDPTSGLPKVPSEFGEFHELFDAANPNTSPEKVLVAGYWFQAVQGHEDLDSAQLNRELKNLGHPSTNVTRDLDSLMKRSPRLVMQVKKQGTTKQARKRYKLTREGERAIERMLTANHANGGLEAEVPA